MAKVIIDVSEFNEVDWSVAKNHVGLAIIRMGYRSFAAGKITMDKRYQSHRAGCEKYGVPNSFYFFPTSVTEQEARNEADWVANELKGVKLAAPVFADSEIADVKNKNGRSDKLSKSDRTRLLKVFCDRLQSHGIPAGVYGSTSWLNTRLDMSKLPYSVWVAQYNTQCEYKGEYLMWQYTSKGAVPGVKGNVDVSVLKTSAPPKAKSLKDYILDQAAFFIGAKENPAGSNNVVFNTHYYGYEVKGPAYPWCCTFIWDIFRICDASSLFYSGKKTAYCPTAMNWFKQVGRFVSIPERGDVAFFNFNGKEEAEHIGFVEKVNGNGTITTIEGNTSVTSDDNGGSVMRRIRPLSVCLGFGRPNYTQVGSPKVDTTNFPMIKKGSARKDYVTLLQNALTLRGYPVTADGIFNAATELQVTNFQKAFSLEVDGVVGPMTWNALFNI